jgi:hypothetical protein
MSANESGGDPDDKGTPPKDGNSTKDTDPKISDHDRSTPELGNFAEDFAKFAAGSLERLAPHAGDSRDALFADSAWDHYKLFLDFGSRESGNLFGLGTLGQRNDFAGLRMALFAQIFVGSAQWKAKDRQTFCNYFVNAVGNYAGLLMPTVGGAPANTAKWASGGISCWTPVDKPSLGDLYLIYDPSAPKVQGYLREHIGVVVDPVDKQGISASPSTVKQYTSWEYDSEGKARSVESRTENDLSGHSEVRFYEYSCGDYSAGGTRRNR